MTQKNKGVVPMAEPDATINLQGMHDTSPKEPPSSWINRVLFTENIQGSLYEASTKGNWKAILEMLRNRADHVGCSINTNMDTPLHIAATSQNTKIVKNLVMAMSDTEVAHQNSQGNTALSLAAAAGNVDVAKILFARSPRLIITEGFLKMAPVELAAYYGKRDMVAYLYGKYKFYDDFRMNQLFLACLQADLFDAALKILGDHIHDDIILFEDRIVWTALNILARKPYVFADIEPCTIKRIINSIICLKVGSAMENIKATELLRTIWQLLLERYLYSLDGIPLDSEVSVLMYNRDLLVTKPSQILFTAVEMDNVKFVVELIREYPNIVYTLNDNKLSIFHVAVIHRRESIYNLLYEIGPVKDMITSLKDNRNNNMLHLVGMKAERDSLEDIPGAAFQMQRELLWFKEVEAMIPVCFRDMTNNDGQTPHKLFVKSHKEMVIQGEKWMKGTATQCMVVAALITTVVFSVAFTIPGGYDQNNGLPMYLRKAPFIAFVIIDAISLILSSTSILMFLSILTSRYTQNDFLESLPKKLMVGLTTLFLSIFTMMTAFSCSFFLLYNKKLLPIPIVISVLGVIPAILYAKLQYPLLMDAYRATYSSKCLFKPKKPMFDYYYNPRL